MSIRHKDTLLNKVGRVLPWLILLFGAPAVYFFDQSGEAYRQIGASLEYEEYYKLFHLFYALSMGYGAFVILLEFIISAIGLSQMIQARSQKEDTTVIRKFRSQWLRPILYILGTLLLMLLVHTFTYGMSV